MNRTNAPNSSSGLYVDDNPATSTQGTLLIATDLNQRQEEIVNAIELAGITPSSGDDTQLGQAIKIISAPTGSLQIYLGSTPPSGWLLCDGSAVSRTTYSGLFGVIGTTYGAGNGSTTFNLPDMRAAVPVGAGTSTQFTQNETKTLGQAYDDKFQAWQLGMAEKATGGPVYYGSNRIDNTAIAGGAIAGHGLLQMKNDQQGVVTKATAYSDGTNGDPRTGDSTHGKQVAVNYIVRT